MSGLVFDVAHLLAGSLVLTSFVMLYQDRLYALLGVYRVHALLLACSVAWQAYVQDAPHLYVTAVIALLFKALIIPGTLQRIVVRLGIHREIETVVGTGLISTDAPMTKINADATLICKGGMIMLN